MMPKSLNILLSLLLVSFTFSCFDPIALDHPDDPYSNNYILGVGSDCPESVHERINANAAKLFWKWNDSTYTLLKEHGDYILLKRYKKHSVLATAYELDTIMNIAPEWITIEESNGCQRQDNEMVVSWIDSTLEIENDYQYTVRIGNSKGLAKDSVNFNYRHEFYYPDSFRVSQEYSDTSIICSWKNSYTLHNKIKIDWVDSLGNILDEKLIISGNSIILSNLRVPLNQLTHIVFRYGLNIADTVIWQRRPFEDSIRVQFDPVNNGFAVNFQKNINRISWQYNSRKVIPEDFVLFLSDEDSVIIANNPINTIQISGEQYYVYFDRTGIRNKYRIVPKTEHHTGKALEVVCNLLPDAEIDGFSYVDFYYPGSDQGFYISLYEMNIADFIEYYNENYSDLDYYFSNADTSHLSRMISIGNNLLQIRDQQYANRPIEWISWDLANSIANYSGHRLPTNDQWTAAAKASTNDYRKYPWGDSNPDSTRCNFNFGFDSTSVEVDSLENGRVDIYTFQEIKGPYNMAGNVKEWTLNPVRLTRNSEDAHLARGGSWWDTNPANLEINYIKCIYTSSDQVGGIRLVK